VTLNGASPIPKEIPMGEIAIQCVEDSKRWFAGDTNNIPHMTLGLCGEVGEFANIVKKIQRRSLDPDASITKAELAMEMADVLTYAFAICGLMGWDPFKLYAKKRIENEHRFGPGSGAAHRPDAERTGS